MKSFRYESMGTEWEISIAASIAENLKTEIKELSQEFDALYSRFKKDSLVWHIANGGAGHYEVPLDFTQILQLYVELYEASEKKLNPLIGFTLSDLGYDEAYSLREKEIIRLTPDLLETVEIISETKIVVKEKVLFDFGALGKGYFVDRIAALLKTKDFTQFLVNGSGDLYYFGAETGRFALEDPNNSRKAIGVLEIKKEDSLRAFCASGINRRRWPARNKGNKENNHVINPLTLESSDFITATWVQAETAALADALATCLFFCSPEKFKSYDFKYAIVNNQEKIKSSLPLI